MSQRLSHCKLVVINLIANSQSQKELEFLAEEDSGRRKQKWENREQTWEGTDVGQSRERYRVSHMVGCKLEKQVKLK